MKTFFLYLLENKKKTWILFLIWTTIIFVGCFLPGYDIPDVQIPFIDKWVHFVFFAGYSFLALCLFKKPNSLQKLLILLSAAVLGLMVELIQGSGLIPGRGFEWNDILADSVGGVIGIILFGIMKKWSLKE